MFKLTNITTDAISKHNQDKKMKFFHLLLFLLLLSTSCTRVPPFEKAGYTSINNHIQQMNKSEHWVAESIGGSFNDDVVKKLNVGFIVSAEQFNIEYARSILVKGIEIFLNSINTNEKLIPYLHHYPFTHQDLVYSVALYTPEGKWLGFSFLINGELCFFIADEFKHLEKVHEEPYSEALEKIKAGLVFPMQHITDSTL